MVAARAGETTLEATLAAAKAAVPETNTRLFNSTSMGSGSRYFEGVIRDTVHPSKYGNCGEFASAAGSQQGPLLRPREGLADLLVPGIVRPAHAPDIVGGGVFAVAQPGDRPEGQGVDPPVLQDGIVDMHADDPA